MNQQTILTLSGKQKLEAELAELKGPQRTAISKRLKSAIEMGDLSENADYKAAKEDQGFLEGRIQELEALLSNAIVVDESEARTDIVQVGSTVRVRMSGGEEEEFQIVGAKEANARERKISYESPIGAALCDHHRGDKVKVVTPGGEINIEILEIK